MPTKARSRELAQSNTSQAIASHRTYDAFGNIATSSGTWTGPFGYGGSFGCQEDSTGLQLLGHRCCDPSTGRFLTRDPIRDGRNWYAYYENDPVNLVDPTGLFWKEVMSVAFGLFVRGLFAAAIAPVSVPVIIAAAIFIGGWPIAGGAIGAHFDGVDPTADAADYITAFGAGALAPPSWS